MDAIGADAEVNKERVYQYFGNKRGLFDAVLADRLRGLLTAAGAPGNGPDGVGAYAGALFDHFAARPELARLLAWESLEFGEAAGAPDRADTCATQVQLLSRALPGLSALGAAQLLLSLVSLCAGWWTLSHATAMIAPDATTADRRLELIAQGRALALGAIASADAAEASRSAAQNSAVR